MRDAAALTVEDAPLPEEDGHGARDSIVREVIEGLYAGRYAPGQRLVEAQLTATCGMSRGPVREALNLLAARGIVELAPQRGARVKLLAPAEAIDILVVAQALLATAARLAAANAAEGDAAAQMRAALARVDAFDAESEGAAFARARDGFYATLTRIADNGELRRIMPSVQVHIVRVQFRPVLRPTERHRPADYRRIAAAVIAGRPAAAEAAVRAHIARSIDRLVALGRPDTNARMDRMKQP